MTTDAPERTSKQSRLPGMEATALEKACEDFIENKIEQAELKIERDELSQKILVEMEKAGKDKLIISHSGENYSFEVVHGEDNLSCKKETRTPQQREGGE